LVKYIKIQVEGSPIPGLSEFHACRVPGLSNYRFKRLISEVVLAKQIQTK